MGFLDAVVTRAFREEPAGTVVIFSGDRRNRGFLVKSEADELKIKSFLKMFYFAHFSILLLGMMLAYSCTLFIINLQALHHPRSRLFLWEVVFLVVYTLVVGLPYFFLWKSYKKAFLNFVSAQDEVSVSGAPAKRQSQALFLALFGLAILILMAAIFFLVGRK